ncbi:12259_t:CDS:10 [Entrophospora sp. SA101]|nr:12259_t:CDS:10 [Entrophospora sp. SA101]
MQETINASLNNKINDFSSCQHIKRYLDSDGWCKKCALKNNKWTSGNVHIDKFIKKTQKKSSKWTDNFLEWIPFENFEAKSLKKIGSGCFSNIYRATWLDGKRVKSANKTVCARSSPITVVLKSIKNSANMSGKYVKEKYYKCTLVKSKKCSSHFVEIYGITYDVKADEYILVTQYSEFGNLRDFIKENKFSNISWSQKLWWLCDITSTLATIHKEGLFHGNLHPGNILQIGDDVRETRSTLVDVGLSMPANDNFADYNEALDNNDDEAAEKAENYEIGRQFKSSNEFIKNMDDFKVELEPKAIYSSRQFDFTDYNNIIITNYVDVKYDNVRDSSSSDVRSRSDSTSSSGSKSKKTNTFTNFAATTNNTTVTDTASNAGPTMKLSDKQLLVLLGMTIVSLNGLCASYVIIRTLKRWCVTRTSLPMALRVPFYITMSEPWPENPQCKIVGGLTFFFVACHMLLVELLALFTYLRVCRGKRIDLSRFDWKMFILIFSISSLLTLIGIPSYGSGKYWCFATNKKSIAVPVILVIMTYTVLGATLFFYIMTIRKVNSVLQDTNVQWSPSSVYVFGQIVGYAHIWVYFVTEMTINLGGILNMIHNNGEINKYNNLNSGSDSDSNSLITANLRHDGDADGGKDFVVVDLNGNKNEKMEENLDNDKENIK